MRKAENARGYSMSDSASEADSDYLSDASELISSDEDIPYIKEEQQVTVDRFSNLMKVSSTNMTRGAQLRLVKELRELSKSEASDDR